MVSFLKDIAFTMLSVRAATWGETDEAAAHPAATAVAAWTVATYLAWLACWRGLSGKLSRAKSTSRAPSKRASRSAEACPLLICMAARMHDTVARSSPSAGPRRSASATSSAARSGSPSASSSVPSMAMALAARCMSPHCRNKLSASVR